MELIIKGEAKEIAALVLAVQERQKVFTPTQGVISGMTIGPDSPLD